MTVNRSGSLSLIAAIFFILFAILRPNIDRHEPVQYTRSPVRAALLRRRSQVVRQRSAKPSSAGSIPAVASKLRLAVPPHFSFESTVESHGWYLLAPFRWDRQAKILRRPEAIDDDVF